MQDDLYDGLLLFGVEYMQKTLNYTRKEIIFNMSKCSSSFSRQLAHIFQQLRVIVGTKALSSILHLPRYNLKYMNRNASRGGCCNICDLHFFRLKNHLDDVHELNNKNISLYMTLFQELRYFMPKDYREVQRVYGELNEKAFKPKPKKNKKPIIRIKYFSKDTFQESNCFICGECGKIVRKNNKKHHIKNHKCSEIVECFMCDMKMTKKQYKSHAEFCNSSAPDSIELRF